MEQSCECPAGKQLTKEKKETTNKGNNKRAFFKGKVSDCRHCELKGQCLRNPAAVDKPKGDGRQVSFLVEKAEGQHTDWMTNTSGMYLNSFS
ncbi:MAG: hypothetical protein GQ582_02710 [Methyloprofundus sp.]|nr:hypothetical protein [Methyloprofundus sp.]